MFMSFHSQASSDDDDAVQIDCIFLLCYLFIVHC